MRQVSEPYSTALLAAFVVVMGLPTATRSTPFSWKRWSFTARRIFSSLSVVIFAGFAAPAPIRTDHALYPDAAELTPVTLYLSKGKPGEQPLGYMPQMVGLVVDPYDVENGYGPLTEFLQQEVLLHFQLVDSDLPYGTVLSQSQEPGTLIRKDTVLGLSISNHRD